MCQSNEQIIFPPILVRLACSLFLNKEEDLLKQKMMRLVRQVLDYSDD